MDSSRSDIELILSRRFDNGADYWASPDGKIYVGNPYSTLSCLGMLYELDVPQDHEAVAGAIEVVLAACRDDGKIRVGPTSPMYPCYTSEAARVLCRFGLAHHPALQRTVAYLVSSTHEDGGWRCSFSRFGKGPETECSNPGATLYALDVFRHFDEHLVGSDTVEKAVESLLRHWDIRIPTGPCHWGIGTTFMQVDFPFIKYNLFFFVYVLSFFARAKSDSRFREAFAVLESKLDASGSVVVENPHRRLKGLQFCARGRPSARASRRFDEIRRRMDGRGAT